MSTTRGEYYLPGQRITKYPLIPRSSRRAGKSRSGPLVDSRSSQCETGNDPTKYPDFRFTFEELSGAIADFATILPFAFGIALVTALNLSYMLLFFGLWYILMGIYYKAPVPIEPMKAIGAIVIAENLSQGEITAAGIIVGILFLVLGFCKGMTFIQKKVPTSVVRGIQLGLALLLIKASINFVVGDYLLAALSIGIIILFTLIVKKYSRVPNISALIVILIGIITGVFTIGIPQVSLIAAPKIIIPTVQDFVRGGVFLAVPQAPLTITNAILATSLLMHDLFNRDVDPNTLSKSIGLMNLLSTPFGGIPMCHGATDLAAKYRFGGRTGGASIISGLIIVPIALFLATPEFVALISFGIIGALLIFVVIELIKHSLKTDSYIVTGIVGVLALMINITVGFIIGMIVAYILMKICRPPETS